VVKKLEVIINHCKECPYRTLEYNNSHTRVTGVCNKMTKFTPEYYPSKIPSWCPLPDL